MRDYPYDRAPRPLHPRREQRHSELRVFGLHACLAVFQRRRDAIRKVYLEKDRLGQLRDVIAHCVANRIGYRLLPGDELEKLTKSPNITRAFASKFCVRLCLCWMTCSRRSRRSSRHGLHGWMASAIRTISVRCCAVQRISVVLD